MRERGVRTDPHCIDITSELWWTVLRLHTDFQTRYLAFEQTRDVQ